MAKPWTPPNERIVILHRETCQEHEDPDHWIDQTGECHGTWIAIRKCYRYVRHEGFQRYAFAIPQEEIPLPIWLTDMHTADTAELSQPDQDW